MVNEATIFLHTTNDKQSFHPVEKKHCLAIRLNAIITHYRLSKAPTLANNPEQFTFSTDRKQKYLVINQQNPRKVKHIAPSWYPCHVAFGRKIVQRNSGRYCWKVQVPSDTRNLRLGVYFGPLVQNFKSDFGHHIPRFFTSAETYFSGSTCHIAGIHCGDGSVFGGRAKPALTQDNIAFIKEPVSFGDVSNQVIRLDLDSDQDTLTITCGKKTHAFVIEGLKRLRLSKKFWESVFWASIGDGGKKREVEIISFTSVEKQRAKL